VELGVHYGSAAREARWEAQLAKLAAYKAAHGNCRVPMRLGRQAGNLGAWVYTQRKYKRLLDRGEACREMSAERAAKLEALGCEFAKGFVWVTPEDVAWEAQLAQLTAYKVQHGDCNVPDNWPEDPRLGRWVSKQRTLKSNLDAAAAAKATAEQGGTDQAAATKLPYDAAARTAGRLEAANFEDLVGTADADVALGDEEPACAESIQPAAKASEVEDSSALAAELQRRGLVRRGHSFTSRHKGVSWNKNRKKWEAKVCHGGKNEHLGTFATEAEAKACRDARCRELGMDLDEAQSSVFRGVFWHKVNRKWKASISVDGKNKYLGSFEATARGEVDAALAFDAAARAAARRGATWGAGGGAKWGAGGGAKANFEDLSEPGQGMAVERVAKLDALGFAWTTNK
jgi:hypothetical protein